MAVAAAALAIVASFGSAATASAIDLYNVSAQQTLINQDRAANGGLSPLVWNNCLANIAQQNADRMAAQGFISHTDGVNLDLNCVPGATRSGENVADDSAGIDDALANTMFMNSPGHRANILGAFYYVATAWTVAPNGYGYVAEEFLMAPALSSTPDPFKAMYTTDAFGGVHADGSSVPQSGLATWPGWRIVQSAALLADGSGGYTLDGFGGLHPFGSAAAVQTTAYWSGWNIARDVALLPGSTATNASGYVLDGFGGLHPFGGAPAPRTTAYWSGWDIATGLALLGDGTGGYVLDGWGGLHPFAVGTSPMPPTVSLGGYWQGWKIARSVALTPGSTAGTVSGVTLDGYGGVHPFNGPGVARAAAPSITGYWSGWNIARSVAFLPASTQAAPQGWVLDGLGGIHPFGGAPSVLVGAYWSGADLAVKLLVQ